MSINSLLGEKTVTKQNSFKLGGDSKKCSVCQKSVYQQEKVEGLDVPIHQSCFYCAFQGCKVKLSLKNYGAYESVYYCTNHFKYVTVHTNPLEKKDLSNTTVGNVQRKDTWKEDVEKLKEFKNRGILTEEEYEKYSNLILEKGL